jgi:hypothetical protein
MYSAWMYGPVCPPDMGIHWSGHSSPLLCAERAQISGLLLVVSMPRTSCALLYGCVDV